MTLLSRTQGCTYRGYDRALSAVTTEPAHKKNGYDRDLILQLFVWISLGIKRKANFI